MNSKYSILVVSWFILLKFLAEVEAATLTPNLGELCPEQDVVLTCTSGTGSFLRWRYDGAFIAGGGFSGTDDINMSREITASGFVFSVELTSAPPDFASTLSFRADTAMNGDTVSCSISTPDGNGGFDIQDSPPQTLQVTQIIPSPPTDVRLTSIMNNSESASVTIEWDPPSQGGSQLSYIIRITPDLISGIPIRPPITTFTSTTMTVNYNTDYTITITASNCVGNGMTSAVGLSVNIVNCSDPSPVAGVTFSPFFDTTEGASISFDCEPGLEPQRDDVSVCSSNGSWVPDPAQRLCSTPVLSNCGQPVLSPNVSVISTTGTTEGDTVTLQCRDGLFPVIPVMITCNSAGVWSPDPAELVCTIMPAVKNDCSRIPEDTVIINSTSSQLSYICNCSTLRMIVKTAVCAGNGTWLPQIMCEEDVCTTDSEPADSPISSTVVVIIVVVFSVIGLLVLLTVGALVVYGCYKWKLSHQSKHHLPPSSPPPPAPLYEDIVVPVTLECKDELNENVAYGIWENVELNENVSYGIVK